MHRDHLESDNEAYLVTINSDAILPMELYRPKHIETISSYTGGLRKKMSIKLNKIGKDLRSVKRSVWTWGNTP
jgi:hypothetical protein